MKKYAITIFLLMSVMGGVIKVQEVCKPKKIHIVVKLQKSGKKVLDKTILNPQNRQKINFSFNRSSEYDYWIESFPPNSVCAFINAKGNKLPPNPNIMCSCIQQIKNKAINVKPGKWLLTSKWVFDRPIPGYVPTPSEVLCVKNPYEFFAVEKVADILGKKECPLTMKEQSYTYGKWARFAQDYCDIHGEIKYLGDKIKEKIRYISHDEGTPSSTLYINGKRIGDCNKTKKDKK